MRFVPVACGGTSRAVTRTRFPTNSFCWRQFGCTSGRREMAERAAIFIGRRMSGRGSRPAVWFNDRNVFNQLGLKWDGAWDSADAARQSSALMPVSALAEPITADLAFAKGAGDPAFSHTVGTASGTLAWAASNATSAGYLQ